MHAYILIGSYDTQEKYLTDYFINNSIDPIDKLYINTDRNSIGISDVRTFIKSIYLAPQKSEFKAAVIKNAEKLTVAAQNALLKTLEEPPKHTIIFLSCTNDNNFLPTIKSRCSLIKTAKKNLQSSNNKSINSLVEKINKSKTGEIIKFLEPFSKNKSDLKKLIYELGLYASYKLEKSKSKSELMSLTQLSKKIIKANKMINVNVNSKLVLESIFINS